MFLLKRIIVIVTSILGAFTGMVLLALMNAAFQFNLSLSQVSLFGIAAGVLAGMALGYYFVYLIIKRTKRFINTSLTAALGKFAFLRRI